MNAKSLRGERRRQSGRSLLEYLIVVVIIGVVTLACVPMIQNTSEKASEGKAMQNARAICGLYNGARTFGVVFSSPTKAGIVNQLFEGVDSPSVPDCSFQMPRLEGHELVDALRYCRYDPLVDLMTYQPQGNEMLEVVLVQKGAGPAAIGAVRASDLDSVAPENSAEKKGPWQRLPTWFTSDPEQSQRVLDYIQSNPRMVHLGVEFGSNEWRAEQGGDGLWWPEYRTR